MLANGPVEKGGAANTSMNHPAPTIPRLSQLLPSVSTRVPSLPPFACRLLIPLTPYCAHDNIALHLKTIDVPHLDQWRYNRPTASEIAVVMVGSGEEATSGTRDIVVHTRMDLYVESHSYIVHIPLYDIHCFSFMVSKDGI